MNNYEYLRGCKEADVPLNKSVCCSFSTYFRLRDDWIKVVSIEIANVCVKPEALEGCRGLASYGVVEAGLIWMGYDYQCLSMVRGTIHSGGKRSGVLR
jgi:hypothetical protein